MGKLCQVCATAEAKYKCPGCRAPYCSAACYKAHKEVPCAPAATAAPVASSATPAAAVTVSNGQTSAPGGSSSSQQQPSLSTHKFSEQEELVVDASQLLSIEQLDELRALPIVHKSLEDPAIRELLTKVCITRIAMLSLPIICCLVRLSSFCCLGLTSFLSVPPLPVMSSVYVVADRRERQPLEGAREGAAQPRVRKLHVPDAGRGRCEIGIEPGCVAISPSCGVECAGVIRGGDIAYDAT